MRWSEAGLRAGQVGSAEKGSGVMLGRRYYGDRVVAAAAVVAVVAARAAAAQP